MWKQRRKIGKKVEKRKLSTRGRLWKIKVWKFFKEKKTVGEEIRQSRKISHSFSNVNPVYFHGDFPR